MEAGATALLERRWAAEAQGRVQQSEALVARHAALLAAVHYSRGVVRRWGWEPWRAAARLARQRATAARLLGDRACLASALAVWALCRTAAAWRAVAADACAVAAARRQRHRSLVRRALAALRQHVNWAKSISQRHGMHLTAVSFHCWRQYAAAGVEETQQQLGAASRHCEQQRCRQALAAWQAGAVRCKQDRVVAQRREQRWGTVQQYLAEHRQAKAAASSLQQHGGGSGCGSCSILDCWADSSGGHSSSAENSFDPNAIFACSSQGRGGY